MLGHASLMSDTRMSMKQPSIGPLMEPSTVAKTAGWPGAKNIMLLVNALS